MNDESLSAELALSLCSSMSYANGTCSLKYYAIMYPRLTSRAPWLFNSLRGRYDSFLYLDPRLQHGHRRSRLERVTGLRLRFQIIATFRILAVRWT